MKFNIASCSIAIVSAVLVTAGHISSAEDPETIASQNVDAPPSFETLRAAALENNADIRLAEAQLESARLQVTKELMSYYRQWQSDAEALAAATSELSQAERDVERLKPLSGAVSGARLLEAERRADVARRQVATAKQHLNAVQSMFPYLVGGPLSTEGKENATDRPRAAEKMPESVRKLLAERMQYLKQIAELRQEAYLAGEIGVEAVFAAQRNVLAAKLELANTSEDRITIREQMLKSARQLEEFVNQASLVNKATPADVLSAKAWSLRVEADLERDR